MLPRSVACLCILACLTSVSALAGEKIAVVATGLDAQAQLDEVLCVSQNCVATEKVVTAGRIDGKKLSQQDVKFTVIARREKRGLEVQVKDASGNLRYTENVDAGAGGKIRVGALVSLAAKIIDSIENDAPMKVAKLTRKPALSKKAVAKAKRLAKKNAKKFAARGEKKKTNRG